MPKILKGNWSRRAVTDVSTNHCKAAQKNTNFLGRIKKRKRNFNTVNASVTNKAMKIIDLRVF